MHRSNRVVRRLCAGLLTTALTIGTTGAAAAESFQASADVIGGSADSVRVSRTGDIRSLAEALRRVRAGGRIVVDAGTYAEPTIEVTKAVEIVGRPGAVLDGRGSHQIMSVLADDVTVRGLVFRDVGVSYMEDRAGVKTDGVRGCVIEDNRFEDTFFAIYLARTSDCRVARNVVVGHARSESGSGNGIHLWDSHRITVEGNRVSGQRDGIYFEFVTDSRIRGNLSERNLRYGLHFMFSDGCRYEGNVFRENSAGVAVMYTKHVVMTENRIEDNWGSASYGLLLKELADSRIERNLFRRNSIGLYLEGSNRIEVRGNAFERNGWGVKLMANSEDDRFEGNDFVANAFDVATNSRHTASEFRGNYWDEYRGYDLDHDGRGDVAFRPVRLFSVLVETNEPALALLRSPFVALLDAAERVLPALTPTNLVDPMPAMARVGRQPGVTIR